MDLPQAEQAGEGQLLEQEALLANHQGEALELPVALEEYQEALQEAHQGEHQEALQEAHQEEHQVVLPLLRAE